MKKSRDMDKFVVRLPDGVRDTIAADAITNHRSMNQEIVYRLLNVSSDLAKANARIEMLERALNDAQAIANKYTRAACAEEGQCQYPFTRKLAERISGIISGADPVAKEFERVTAERDAALADAERLREALKPFAECAEQIEPSEDGEEWAKFRLLVKDYRAAYAALNHQHAQDCGECGDAYQGAREDLSIWKRRALEAESKVRELQAQQVKP